MKRIFCACVLIGSAMSASAQATNQVWLDFQVDYPFGNKYLFEVTTSYQKVVTGPSSWRSFFVSPSFEDNLTSWFTLTAALPMTSTLQKEGANSFEITPSLGGKFFLSQGKRLDANLVSKIEQRHFHKIETDEWEVSNRLRIKAEAWFSINGSNLFTDNLWYLIADYEEFIVVDQQVNERFAYIRRGRLGLGYRLNYAHRFELIYTKQSTRDQVDGDFINSDNILQLRYKLYLNAPKLN